MLPQRVIWIARGEEIEIFNRCNRIGYNVWRLCDVAERENILILNLKTNESRQKQ
jgi:hypothetical protein